MTENPGIVYFLLATTADRVEMAITAIRTMCHRYPNWRMIAVLQGHTPAEVAWLKAAAAEASLFWPVILPEPVGMHNAKMLGLEAIMRNCGDQPFAVVSVDDDMEFVDRTDLEPAIAWAQRPDIGLVSGGWINHESRLENHKTPPDFVNQAIVYTGGGLCFDRKIAELLLTLPRAKYYSDNTEWSMRVYVAGYVNGRYRGSVAIHRVCKKGGRRAWVNAGEEKVACDYRLLEMKKAKAADRPGAAHNDQYLIGTEADLTDLAKRLHKQNREVLTRG